MDAELRAMIMSYRVTELQALLAFAGKNKQGRKNELQARALELVRSKTPQVVLKMRELFRVLQICHYVQPDSAQGASSMASPSSSRYDSGYYSSGNFKQGQQENSFGRSNHQSIGFPRAVSVDGQFRSVPICPDVKLRELPFFDVQSVLIRPTSLLNNIQKSMQEAVHSFSLSPNQAAEIAFSKGIRPSNAFQSTDTQFNIQVQVRFCALDTTDEDQDDCFPKNLELKVNGHMIPLPAPIPSNRPGVEPKRPSKPVNVTNYVKCSAVVTNVITVKWVADGARNFAVSVNIVKSLTAEELFLRLKSKRIQPADFTRGRIKEITTSEEEDLCAPTSIRVSVACPLGKNRMMYPCRATTCKHLQCFDANLFLMMNEKKPSFICPVCNKRLKFNELCIDGYFMDVIKKLSIDDGNDIELFPDGRWEPVVKVKKEIEDVGPPPKKRMKPEDGSSSSAVIPSFNDTIDLDDDIQFVEEDAPATADNSSKKSTEPEVIDLIDSSDDEETETETARISEVSERSETVTPTLEAEMVESPVEECPPTPQFTIEELDDSDDDDTIGIRPRRRAKKVNYIEDSSTDSSTNDEAAVVKKNTNARRPKSPACIELSDSDPSSPEISRAFAAVSSPSSRSSSRSSSVSPSYNNRSGSGSSTLYSPSATATTPTGIGSPSPSPMDSMSRPHLPNPSSSTFSYSATTSQTQSASLFSDSPSPVPSTLPSSSLYFSSTSTTVPGYPAYDATSGWDADLDSFINVQPRMGYGQMNLADFINPSTNPNPSTYLGFAAHPDEDPEGRSGFGWM